MNTLPPKDLLSTFLSTAHWGAKDDSKVPLCSPINGNRSSKESCNANCQGNTTYNLANRCASMKRKKKKHLTGFL